ncbi:GCN5 family acetyltransferase [Streptomyces sp. AcH 505]|uniref:GNAT family N-acetyltransferase n=1 Tax=unclassified Streptomyces TaxID=2593676 RepID=UPI0005920B2F|nr:GNAT family N-acetyltransferase [Streptomyces sp. NBC_00370]KIF70977.1 GCN5 family acetyltransferase [Streptomyces sp. AcH 505]
MEHSAVLTAFDRQMRQDATAEGPGVRVERTGGVVRQAGAAHDWNGVLWSDPALDGAAADAAIVAQIERFAPLGYEFEWKLYGHDRPADLAERLLAAGFVPEDTETVLVAEVGKLSTRATLPAGVRLRPVTDAAGMELLSGVHEQAFGMTGTAYRERLLTQLAEAPETVSAVVATAGDTPVSAARMELPPGKEFAGLWGGGTLEAWRGKGIYRALVAHRAEIAAARGYRYLQVDALETSRPILERLGFTALTTTTPYVYKPVQTP